NPGGANETRRARRAHESLPPGLRLARDADARGRGLRRRTGISAGQETLDRLDALLVPLQPDPAAGGIDSLRRDEGGIAGGPASRRPALCRRARAARRARLRDGAPDRLTRPRQTALAAAQVARGEVDLLGAILLVALA